MEVAFQREATVSFEIPSLPMAYDTTKADSQQRVSADKSNAISPHQESILSSRIVEIQPLLGTTLLNPSHAEQQDQGKCHQDQPASLATGVFPAYQEAPKQQANKGYSGESENYN